MMNYRNTLIAALFLAHLAAPGQTAQAETSNSISFQFFHGQRYGDSNYVESEGFGLGDGTRTLRQVGGYLPTIPAVAIVEAGKNLLTRVYISENSGIEGLPPGMRIASARLGYRINGGKAEFVAFPKLSRVPGMYGGSAEAETQLTIPADAGGRIELWTELTNEAGQLRYVSNHGQNFSLAIAPALSKSIRFLPRDVDGNFPVTEEGDLRIGQTLYVDYELRRMDDLGMYDGNPRNGYGRAVIGSIAFRDSTGRDLRVLEWYVGHGKPAASIVPEGTATVAVWFRGQNSFRTVWDSKFGENFIFLVKR